MNSLKDKYQKRQPLLGPLFKVPAPVSCYRPKGLVFCNIFCSTSAHKFSTIFETFKKVTLRGRPCNSLIEAGNENMKSGLCSEHHSEHFLFSSAFKNVYHFQDISGRKFIVLALLIADVVIYGPNNQLVRWKSSR